MLYNTKQQPKQYLYTTRHNSRRAQHCQPCRLINAAQHKATVKTLLVHRKTQQPPVQSNSQNSTCTPQDTTAASTKQQSKHYFYTTRHNSCRAQHCQPRRLINAAQHKATVKTLLVHRKTQQPPCSALSTTSSDQCCTTQSNSQNITCTPQDTTAAVLSIVNHVV